MVHKLLHLHNLKKHTVSGGTQTTPPQEAYQDEGIQGQPDHNQVEDDNWQTQSNGKSGGKRQDRQKEAIPGYLTPSRYITGYKTMYLEQILVQEILEQVGQPSSAQHVGNIHTGGRTAHMITFAQPVIIMIMLPICVGPHNRVLPYAFTVAVLTTGQAIAPETHGTTESNCMELLITWGSRTDSPTPKIWEVDMVMHPLQVHSHTVPTTIWCWNFGKFWIVP